MSRESSIFSTILFSLLIILFISEIQARRIQQVCTSSCGDIKNISYPFRLKGDPAVCGHRGFELSCQSNQTILEFRSGKYYVKRISYNESIISVVDIDIANGNCSYPNNSVLARELMDGNGYFGCVPNIEYTHANFIKCSKNISSPAYREIPCFSGNKSGVYVNYGSAYVADLPVSCSLISMVPLHYEYHQETDPSYETIQKLLDSGFDLGWSGRRDIFGIDGFQGRRYYYTCYVDSENRRNRNAFSHLKPIFRSFLKHFFTSRFSVSFLPYYIRYPDDFLEDFFRHNYGFRYTMDNMGHLLADFARLICALFVARFILAQIVLLVYIIHNYSKIWKTVDNVEKFLHNQQSWMPKRYSYAEIMVMTNNFRDKLGQGGFGSVYKGQLRSGCFIAVKVLEKSKFSAEEFINEVSTIGRIHHANIVQLVGFCSEGSKRGLVYEYMPYGSLDRHLFSKKGKGQSFGWEKLQEIALGIARGIEYLHRGCDFCILHFDIKPHNILLDHNFIPKVSDFGLAKFYPKENDFVSVSATRGTIGYIAPELISRTFGVVSCKSDVYSFGMLLLEMAGGRRNSSSDATCSSKAYFPSWVYDRICKGGDLELRNVTEIEGVIARKLCMIGLWCIQVKATDRPTMSRVLEMLEVSADDIPMPPKPFFSSSEHTFTGEIESDSSIELLLSESMAESGADAFGAYPGL